jgi:hypothetical protein
MYKPQSKLERLFAVVRQWKHPAEFRIGEPTWPGEIAEKLCEVLKRQSSEPRRPTAVNGLVDEQIVAIGTRLWRLHSEMMRRSEEARQANALRYAYRYLEALWEQLAEAGVEIRDHTGEAVPKTGIYLLKTIAHQPMSGIKHHRVIETLKPTIYFNKKILQVGEVIVGTPEQPD